MISGNFNIHTYMKKLLLLLFTLITCIGVNASTIGGNCGNSVTWGYQDGVLTIASTDGQSTMSNYSAAANTPWYEYRNQITTVAINNVTNIGDYSFAGCDNITKVTIGSGTQMTTIGEHAFNGCTTLPSIELPSTVTTIKSYAFTECRALTSVTATGLYYINDYAFDNCVALTSFTVPATVANIGSYAFRNCTQLSNLVISSGVKTIGDNAFASCTALQYVGIPSTVTSIGQCAFYKSGLIAVYLPSTITSVDNDAFYECSSLKSVYAAATPATLGSSAFPTAATTMIYGPTVDDACWKNGGYHVTQTDFWLYDATANTITNTSNNSLNVDVYQTGLTIAANKSTEMTSIDLSIPVINPSAQSFSILKINNEAFKQNTNIASIVFPASLKVVDNDAFEYCTTLASVTVNEGLTTINQEAFYGCTALKSLELPTTLETVGYLALSTTGSSSQTNVTDFIFKSIPQFTTSFSLDRAKSIVVNLTDASYVYVDPTNASVYSTIGGNVDVDTKTSYVKGDITSASYSRTMSNTWGTIVLPFDAKNTSDYAFYSVTNTTPEDLYIKKMADTDVLAAGTPALVRKLKTTDNNIVFSAATHECVTSKTTTLDITTQNASTTLAFTPIYQVTPLVYPDNKGYIISNNCFWSIDDLLTYKSSTDPNTTVHRKGADGTDMKLFVDPFRAYFVGTSPASAKLSLFVLGEDDLPSSVESINTITSDTAEYYDLNGRRLCAPQNGINIVKYGNGVTKKVIIK